MRALLLSSALFLSACGQVTDTVNSDATPAALAAETAKYFETSRSRVAVGNLKPGVLGTAYNAKVAGTMYDCHYFKKTVSCNRA